MENLLSPKGVVLRGHGRHSGRNRVSSTVPEYGVGAEFSSTELALGPLLQGLRVQEDGNRATSSLGDLPLSL